MPNVSLQVRPGDCDRFGHVNNAIYVNYIQYALAEILSCSGYAQDWKYESEFFWEMNDLNIEYRQAAMFGDDLIAKTWLIQPDQVRPVFGCEITRRESKVEPSEQSIIRAQAAWQKISRKSGEVIPLSDHLLNQFPQNGGSLPRNFKLPSDNPQTTHYIWEHQIMRAEVGSSGHARPQAMYNWLEEGVFEASAEAGWTPEKRLAYGVLIFQMRHDTEFCSFPKSGDSIRIVSRLVEVRRFRGTWLQEMYLMPQERLLIRNYSTGVFVGLEGKPTSPPPEVMKEIQYG